MNLSTTVFEIYQPFIIAAISVIKESAGINLSKKNIYTQYGKISIGGTAVSIGIRGQIEGTAVYEFSREFTMRLSSRMIKEAQILTSSFEDYQNILESSLKEIANIISGNVLGLIQDKYDDISIEPPIIFLGKGCKLFAKEKKIVVIELTSPFGDFNINLNIRKRME